MRLIDESQIVSGFVPVDTQTGANPGDVVSLKNYGRLTVVFFKAAGVAKFTYHDLRRSCITNWARHLPIHVVRKLAGHSDIKTTQQFYLSVQAEDVARAEATQESLLGKILPSDLTDQKLTNSGQKRAFPGRKVFLKKT